MRKMMKKAIALSLIATMSMSAATIVHAEDETGEILMRKRLQMMPLLVLMRKIQM